MPARPTPVRVVAVLVLALFVGGCADDHGRAVPGSATQALDCAGTPYAEGRGNYDTGPESVQDDPRAALDNWLEEEFFASVPRTGYSEASRTGGSALFTFSTQGLVVAAFVVSDDTDGTDDDRGWGVASYAACDPADGRRRPATRSASGCGPTPTATGSPRRPSSPSAGPSTAAGRT